MKRMLLSVVVLTVIGGLAVVAPHHVYASNASQVQSGVNSVSNGSSTNIGGLLSTVVNMLLYILGAISVIMIVIGGIRYTTSNGDSSSTKAAKDTILYAVIGLVVAIMAYAIVNFVTHAFA